MKKKFISLSGTSYPVQTRIDKSEILPHTVIQSESGHFYELLTDLTLQESDDLLDAEAFAQSGRVSLNESLYSTLRLARHKETGKFCVVKKVPVTRLDKELTIQKHLPDSPNLLKLTDWAVAPSKHKKLKYYMFMELANKGTLAPLIGALRYRTDFTAEERELVKNMVAFDMIKGLKALQDKNIAHRDLKPENMLIFKDATLKWADFGQSDIYEKGFQVTEVKGNPTYFSPEEIKNYLAHKNNPDQPELVSYDPVKSDLYSLGKILYMLDNNSYSSKAKPDFWSNIPKTANTITDLARLLMIEAPEKRLNLDAALKATFFKAAELEKGRAILSQLLTTH